VTNPLQRVVEIKTHETLPLRAAVLRADTPNKDTSYPEDTKPGTIHLGIFDEDKTLVATSTWVMNPWQEDPKAIAIQLRGMAVAVNKQSSGLGKILIDAGVTHAKSRSATYIWAKARDAAMNFYLRNEFVVVGESFTESITQMPHHLVVRELKI